MRCGTPRQCHCEEGASARDAAIHRVSKDAYGECGSFTGSQWIATGYALAMTTRYLRQTKVLRYTTLVSLRGGNEVRDAAIHRVPRDPYGGCGSLTGSQWIATGYALAMTREDWVADG